jgi:glycosyltransferase involved in cell wall biosynthesis
MGVPGLFINGKFTCQRTTGVQRVAHNLLLAIDRQLTAAGILGRATLLVPPGSDAPAMQAVTVRSVAGPGPSLHAWEQLVLPRAARGGLLLNLSGSAPMLGGPHACMLHDAAVFDRPEAYTPAFRHWYRLLFRQLASRGGPLFTVSSFSRARLAHALGVSEERFCVLPCGADHLAGVTADTAVLDHHRLADRPYLLAVGSSSPTKNIPALVEAWRRVQAGRTARLVLVGGHNTRVFAGQQHTETAGLVQLGVVDDAALKALYQHAAGLVFPSTYEGFGLPPLEAMACGCPVAAACAASLPEVCGTAALMFDPHSPSAISEAMVTLLDDAPQRARLRSLGLQRAAAFVWDDAAATLMGHLGMLQ